MKTTYEVTDENGVVIAGKNHPKGSKLPAGATGAQIKAFKRFNQIKEVKEDNRPSKK